jgi:hypothetical protein
VRLVDGDQARAQGAHLGQPLRVAELLGGDEEELRPALADLPDRRALLVGRLGRAHPDRPDLRVIALVEGRDLVLLQREQRRDHHGRPGQQHRRDLVDGRLAAAGGQDDECVAPAQHRPHRLELAGTQGWPAEVLPRDLAQPGAIDRKLHRAAIVPEGYDR